MISIKENISKLNSIELRDNIQGTFILLVFLIGIYFVVPLIIKVIVGVCMLLLLFVIYEKFSNLIQRVQAVESVVNNRILYKKNIIDLYFYQLDSIKEDSSRGIAFEKFLFELFKLCGFNVHRTKDGGDKGIDLIIEKNDIFIFIQAKYLSNKVDHSAVSELASGLDYYYDYIRLEVDETNREVVLVEELDIKIHNSYKCAGWVISNSDYTDTARKLAVSKKITLNNREKLIKEISKLNSDQLILLFNKTSKIVNDYLVKDKEASDLDQKYILMEGKIQSKNIN